MHHLLGRKVIICLIFCFSSFHFSFAQQTPQKYNRTKRKVDINLPNYDDKRLHYGFYLGLAYTRMNIVHSEKFATGNYNNPNWNNKVSNVTPVGTIGFSLGFLLNVKIVDQFHFKIVPSVGFYDRTLRYSYYSSTGADSTNDKSSTQTVESTFIETQFLFKYRSIRRKNHRFYLIGGVKPAIRVGGRRGDDNSDRLALGRMDFCVEYGVGIDLYYQFFKFSPELRFSHGLINLATPDNNIYNQSILSAYSHTVSLLFFFE
ncbi:MAG: outer membrane beta-barrel protein [Bacteroidota bacterium]|nr:outer membrane beta-barrel protein [Bacteroidota bacterium]